MKAGVKYKHGGVLCWSVIMADREERRFAEISRESVKFMAESTGVELGDDVAALLAEDVCYRLREATQV